MPTPYRWSPIADMGGDPKSLTDGELDSLGRVWANQQRDLVEREALGEFEKRLRREWAIETGIIEDVYTLNRGVTRTLIERGIDAAWIPHGASNRDSEMVARIIQDHYEALESMFDFVGGQRPLSTGYVKELHAALLRNQETHTVVNQFGTAFERQFDRGEYKKTSNSPTRPDGSVHEYCPPEHVASEMDEMVRMYSEHSAQSVPVEVDAAWLHHRFTQIHPFADGNGRVARALASLVFIKAGWFPLIVKRDDRARYIEALEKADAGDLRPLVALFVEAQRYAVIQATEIAYDVQPVTTTDQAVAAVRDRLAQRGRVPLPEWLVARDMARHLNRIAFHRLEEIQRKLFDDIGQAGQGFTFGVGGGQSDVESERFLKRAGHSADLGTYGDTVRLQLDTGRREALGFCFYAIGPRFRGIIGVVAYLSMAGAEPVLLDGGTFQINYEEDLQYAQARFVPWLERMIIAGLDQWRRTL